MEKRGSVEDDIWQLRRQGHDGDIIDDGDGGDDDDVDDDDDDDDHTCNEEKNEDRLTKIMKKNAKSTFGFERACLGTTSYRLNYNTNIIVIVIINTNVKSKQQQH